MDVEARSEATTLLVELAAVDIDKALRYGQAWLVADSDGRVALEQYVKEQLALRAAQ